MLFALLCVFGMYSRDAEYAEIKRMEAQEKQNGINYFNMVKRNDIQPLSEEASEAKYFGFFRNPFDFKEIIKSNPAWPVLALYYAGKWAQEGKDNWNHICIMVIGSFTKLGEEFEQFPFYHVMNELYVRVSESNPTKIHNLMLDFAVYFFVNRPLNRDAQKKAFLDISKKYGYPEVGLEYSSQLDGLSTPYKDRFATLFRNPNVVANYPQELKEYGGVW
eukprot:NODE_551_length_6164_cov_0.432811.p4 type:complete len:219 gc:universal NODE_551_length_6164_cov_0.432811:4931-5587(+)